MSQDTTATNSYFNLHTSGIGYLNRIREVPVRRGTPFLACDIAALHGSTDAVEYTRFDCRISGADAEHLVRRCMDAVNAGKKVLLSFWIGDIWVDPFLYEKGERAGQPGAGLKGRLLYIDWIKVDGVMKYKGPTKEDVLNGKTADVHAFDPDAAALLEPPVTAPQTESEPAATTH